MKELYFECQAGISGDMATAALLDLGAGEENLRKALSTVNLSGYSIEISKVLKSGILCTDFNVILDSKDNGLDHDMAYLFGHEENIQHNHPNEYQEEHHHEHSHEDHHHEHTEHKSKAHEHTSLSYIMNIIETSGISLKAKELSKKIFKIISKAEAKAHGTSEDKVHFHEVGAVDSIVDIISFAVCLDDLGIDRVCINEICEGKGSIRSSHGILSIPVPASLNIIEEHSLNLSILNVKGELVTPTGAAIAAAIKTSSTLPSSFKIIKSGLGAGKRKYSIPSILRVMIIESQDKKEELCKLESDIDDSTSETMGFLMEELYKANAKEVHFIPCFMKKNRPAFSLTVICLEKDKEELENIIFLHTSTTGIRCIKITRRILERQIEEIESPYGKIKVKKIFLENKIRFVPEYEDIAELARKTKKGFYDLYREIQELANKI